jgi:DNA polymerase III delta prime subunit
VPPLWVRDRGWRAAAKAQLAAAPGLNRSQRRAIADAMVSSVTLHQGPPGTGKTATLLALVQVLVGAAKGALSAAPGSRAAASSGGGVAGAAARREEAEEARKRWRQMGPVLACANTNAATDNLLEGLAARGVRVVRVGQPAKVRKRRSAATGGGSAARAGRRSRRPAPRARAPLIPSGAPRAALVEARPTPRAAPRTPYPTAASPRPDAPVTLAAAVRAQVREALRHLSLEAQAEATADGRKAVELRASSKVGRGVGWAAEAVLRAGVRECRADARKRASLARTRARCVARTLSTVQMRTCLHMLTWS